MMKRGIFLSVFSLFFFTGCHQFGGGVRVDSGAPHVEKMPPAHAPAHGRRRQHHRYYYYPNAEFYFDVGRNVYFYLDSRGGWAVSASLPHHLRSHLRGHYVEMEMESDKPYKEHHKHKQKYKKNKYKKNKRYKE